MLPLVLRFQVPRAALRPAATACTGLVLLSTPACRPETNRAVIGELLYEGDYVDVYASPGTTICAGSFAEIDRFSHELRQYAEQWNVSWLDEKYRYNWLSDEDWWATRPCGSGEACHYAAFLDDPSTVYARELFLHEVVHAMFGPAHQSHPIFKEGLAEILADGEGAVLPGFDSTSLSSLYAASHNGLNLTEYHKAAFITRFLLDYHGEAGMNIITRATRQMSFDHLERIAAQNHLSIDLLDEQLLGSRTCALPGTRINLPECTSDEVDWVDITRSVRITLACSEGSAHGPINGKTHTTIAFTVPKDDSYEIMLSSDNGEVSGKIGRCGRPICQFTDTASEKYEIDLRKGRNITTLIAGKHWLSLRVALDDTADVLIAIRPTTLGAYGETDSYSEADATGTTAIDPGNPSEEASSDTSDTSGSSSTWPDSSTANSDTTDSTSSTPNENGTTDCDGYRVCMPTAVTASGFSFEYGMSLHVIQSESHGVVLPLCSCQTFETYELLSMEAPYAVEGFERVALEVCLAFAEDEIAAAVEAQNWPEEQVATQTAAATASARASCEAGFRRRYSATDGAIPFIIEGNCLFNEPEEECRED